MPKELHTSPLTLSSARVSSCHPAQPPYFHLCPCRVHYFEYTLADFCLAQSRQFHFFFIRQATPDDSELARGRPNGFHCSVESFFRVLTGREVPTLCPPSDFPGPTDVVLIPRGTKNSWQSFEHSLACQTFLLSQPGNGLAVLTRLSRRSTHQSTALFSARRPLQRPQSQSLPPGKPCLFNSFETLAFPTARRDGDTTRPSLEVQCWPVHF